eukprot:3852419-Pleurochrysis_carterae.AAC.1
MAEAPVEAPDDTPAAAPSSSTAASTSTSNEVQARFNRNVAAREARARAALLARQTTSGVVQPSGNAPSSAVDTTAAPSRAPESGVRSLGQSADRTRRVPMLEPEAFMSAPAPSSTASRSPPRRRN